MKQAHNGGKYSLIDFDHQIDHQIDQTGKTRQNNMLKKIGTLFAISLLVSQSFAALIYDPETNSYIDSDEENVVVIHVPGQEDVEWIPVEEEEPEEMEEDSETSVDSSSDDVERIPVEEEEVVEKAQASEGAGQDADGNPESPEPEEDVEAARVAADAILDVANEPEVITTATTTTIKTHKELNKFLNETRQLLTAYLNDQTADLGNAYNSALTTKYGDGLSDVIACLSDDNDVVQLNKEIETVVDEIKERMELEASEVFADIAQLQYSFNTLKLISKDERDTESSLLSAKIDLLNQNYISLIDFKSDQIRTGITEFINSNRAKKLQREVNVFNRRTKLLDQVKQAFGHFEKSSFFSQTVAGPRADELYVLSSEVYELFLRNMTSSWGRRDPAVLKKFQKNLKPQFDAFVDSQIDELFPYGQVLPLYNNYATLVEAYGLEDSSYICSAVLTNNIVQDIAPVLLEKIQTVQENIAVAQSAVGTPDSWENLQRGFSDAMQKYYVDTIRVEFTTLTSETEEPELTESEKLFFKVKPQVFDFLISMRAEYILADRLESFEDKLNLAQERIAKLLSSDATNARTEIILRAIQEAIHEVLL